MKKIAVIDYGMSNLHSVLKSFQKVINKNYYLSIAQSSKDIEDASILVLPGQGAANSCVEKLSSNFPDLKIVARGNQIKAFGKHDDLTELELRINKIISYFLKYDILSRSFINLFLEYQLLQLFFQYH